MITVAVQVIGGTRKFLDLEERTTVDDIREHLGLSESYQASVNGDVADDERVLQDNDFVTFSPPKIKGA